MKEQTRQKWVLACPQLGLWAGLDERAQIVPVESREAATVFDERDNPAVKLAFYRTITGIDWQTEAVCAS